MLSCSWKTSFSFLKPDTNEHLRRIIGAFRKKNQANLFFFLSLQLNVYSRSSEFNSIFLKIKYCMVMKVTQNAGLSFWSLNFL